MAELHTINSLFYDSSLVAYWKLEGNSLDETVNNHDGGDANITYSIANGKYGQGAGFNGSSSQITVPDSNDLDLTGNHSVLCWFNTNSASAQQGFIEKYISGNGYCFRLTSAGKVLLANQQNGGANSANITGSTTVTINTWQLAVGTYDGSHLRVYLDGVSDATPVAHTLANTASANILRIGTRADAALGWMNGELDEIAIFSKTLTQEEIALIFAAGRTNFLKYYRRTRFPGSITGV